MDRSIALDQKNSNNSQKQRDGSIHFFQRYRKANLIEGGSFGKTNIQGNTSATPDFNRFSRKKHLPTRKPVGKRGEI